MQSTAPQNPLWVERGDPGDVRGERGGGVSRGSIAGGSCGEGTAWGGCERGRGVTAQTVTSAGSAAGGRKGETAKETPRGRADVRRELWGAGHGPKSELRARQRKLLQRSRELKLQGKSGYNTLR